MIQNNNKVCFVWFQQDGSTAHTANLSMNALRDFFSGHLISHLGDVAWPGQSSGPNACDFLIWSYLKSKGFVTTCNTNAELVNYVKDMSIVHGP